MDRNKIGYYRNFVWIKHVWTFIQQSNGLLDCRLVYEALWSQTFATRSNTWMILKPTCPKAQDFCNDSSMQWKDMSYAHTIMWGWKKADVVGLNKLWYVLCVSLKAAGDIFAHWQWQFSGWSTFMWHGKFHTADGLKSMLPTFYSSHKIFRIVFIGFIDRRQSWL